MLESKWRRVPESNRCTRICNPLRHHSANSPPFSPDVAGGVRPLGVFRFLWRLHAGCKSQNYIAMRKIRHQAPLWITPLKKTLPLCHSAHRRLIDPDLRQWQMGGGFDFLH